MKRSIVQLTIAQMLGMFVTTAGGAGVWLIATAMAQPAQLAALGRIVSSGGLAAGLISAGLGQFLLLMTSRVHTEQLKRYFWRSLLIGGAASGIAGLGLAIAQGASSDIIVATALIASAVAITNLQDSIYLGSTMPADVPTKAAVLVGLRLALVLLVAALGQGASWLPAVFVGSQLLIGCLWALLRAPLAFRRHTAPVAIQPLAGAWQAIGFSYLYSSAVTIIMSGIPALITSWAAPAEAGRFYLAWTLAGLLGSVAVAAANAILATQHQGRQSLKHMFGLLALLAGGALGLVLIAPLLLAWSHAAYGNMQALLAALAIGQIGLGLGLAALAMCRAQTLNWSLAVALFCWPALIASTVAIGLMQDGIAGAAQGFALGSLLAAAPLVGLAWQGTHRSGQPATSIVQKATP